MRLYAHAVAEPLFLHGRCHIESPTWTRVYGAEAVVICAECDKEIARLVLAERTERGEG